MKAPYLLEVCTPDLISVCHAVSAGAERVELCSALPLGGLTPSYGLVSTVRTLYPQLTLHVLIRPREGDFVYSDHEVQVMEKDIEKMADMGVDGIVCGALSADGCVSIPQMECLMAAAGPLPVTFHRAFDHCCHPLQSLEEIIRLGCSRILSSGQARTAEEGIPLLASLIVRSAGRIIIMPGCGVNADNIVHILRKTGAREIHASASSVVKSSMTGQTSEVHMGLSDTDDFSVTETDEDRVASLLSQLREIDRLG